MVPKMTLMALMVPKMKKSTRKLKAMTMMTTMTQQIKERQQFKERQQKIKERSLQGTTYVLEPAVKTRKGPSDKRWMRHTTANLITLRDNCFNKVQPSIPT